MTIEVLTHLATTCTDLCDIAIWTEHDDEDDADEDWGIPEEELDEFRGKFPEIELRRI